MKPVRLHTRREFLGNCGIAATGMALPQFLLKTAQSVAAQSGWEQGSGAPLPGFKDDHILVVIQLSGGNDGLNTVIPHQDDGYFKARPRLALEGGKRLRLDDQTSFNNVMSGMKALHDDGKLAIVEGVGYPNPDRSHFRSMEIWHTAVDSDKSEYTGWVGRYFDNCCEGKPEPTSGIYLGNELPQAFYGKKGIGVSFSSPDEFGYVAGKKGDDTRSFRSMNDATAKAGNKSLEFLRHVTDGAMVSQERIHAIARKVKNETNYPGDPFASGLATIARMIAGGLGTRIYYTALGGFDTHSNQIGTQDRLLQRYSEAVAAFYNDLRKMGESRRVLVMTFSEFGRRVAENASGGTDHGTAAPMFLIGDPVKGGFHGKRPSLTDLDQGDLKFTTDFRWVYATVMQRWLGAKPSLHHRRIDPS
ncbi:DUF1501 domain-containing protein, partial [Candidatus Sumerlaeota bacterium]|nr:DUF1501 domain-containing protein [Candidatus Sumerlaeota bacterium]